MDIFCNKDYDKDHPAGTNLNDITTISYSVFHGLVLNDILKYKNDYEGLRKLIDREESLIAFNRSTPKSLLDRLYFRVKDSDTYNYKTYTKDWGLKFSVRIYFTNGKILTRTTEN